MIDMKTNEKAEKIVNILGIANIKEISINDFLIFHSVKIKLKDRRD